MTHPLLFEPPPDSPPAPEACAFYHSIEVPGHPPFAGAWRIVRPREYLGGMDLAGKSVLDVGTATGLLAFAAEAAGAREVVAADLPPGADYDARLPVTPEARARHRAYHARVRDGFWLCHRALSSRVRRLALDVRRLPEGLGRFDVAILGNVLQHLRDPLQAVLDLAPHAGTLVVVEACWLPLLPGASPLALVPFGADHPFSWYQVRPELLDGVLAGRGFLDRTTTWHRQEFLDGRPAAQVPHFTLVARRS